MMDDFRLVMTKGPEPGRTFVLDGERIGLGRDPANDVVINHPQVSRQQARLTRQGGRMVLEDLDSTNGTFVNGVRLTSPHALANKDVVGLGDAVTFTFYGQAVGMEDTVVGADTAPPRARPRARQPTYPSPPSASSASASDRARAGKRFLWLLWIGLAGLALLVVAVAGVVALDAFGLLPAEFYELLRPLSQLLGY